MLKRKRHSSAVICRSPVLLLMALNRGGVETKYRADSLEQGQPRSAWVTSLQKYVFITNVFHHQQNTDNAAG